MKWEGVMVFFPKNRQCVDSRKQGLQTAFTVERQNGIYSSVQQKAISQLLSIQPDLQSIWGATDSEDEWLPLIVIRFSKSLNQINQH